MPNSRFCSSGMCLKYTIILSALLYFIAYHPKASRAGRGIFPLQPTC